MDSAQFGLVLGYTAHLVPFGKECQLIIDYKGLIDMAYRHQSVKRIYVEAICEHDEFVYEGFGRPKHTVNLRKRGEPYAAFATCDLKDSDEPMVVVLANDQIEKVRKSSRSGTSGPWKQWWGEMAKKTAIKRLCKIIPKSIELQEAMEFDDKFEAKAREVNARTVEVTPISLEDLTPSDAAHTHVADKMTGGSELDPDQDMRFKYVDFALKIDKDAVEAILKNHDVKQMDIATDVKLYDKIKPEIDAVIE